ncbi:MAG: hypothetical protein JRJ59_06400 [Deltaproteobacteria bacterium]|nr:hypothetical protein [Deltaproteobacteria bacterium]
MVESSTALVGMQAIAAYFNRSESTVLRMIRQYPDIPIKKVMGNWESDRHVLDEWRRNLVSMGKDMPPKAKPKKAVNRKNQSSARKNQSSARKNLSKAVMPKIRG